MKKSVFTPLLTVALIFLSSTLTQAQQEQKQPAKQTLQQVYEQAVKDFDAARYAEAKVGFEAVLRNKPGFVYARNYLAKAEAAIKNPPKTVQTVETQLAGLTVPKFSFEGATLGSVLDFITQKSTELSDGKVTANVIYKGPAEDRDKKLVTLSLANVPLTEVIRYIGAQVGVRFTYDQYAVVGTPIDQADPAAAANVQVQQQGQELQKEAPRTSFLQEREEAERKAAQTPFQ